MAMENILDAMLTLIGIARRKQLQKNAQLDTIPCKMSS